jgi:hypothetical protein
MVQPHRAYGPWVRHCNCLKSAEWRNHGSRPEPVLGPREARTRGPGSRRGATRSLSRFDGRQPTDRQIALSTTLYPHAVGVCVEAVQLIFKAAGGTAVYQRGPLDRCVRDILTMNQHVVGTMRTYEMAGRALFGLEPLRWLF